MKQFYTDTVSDELTKLLKVKGFPVAAVDTGFTVSQIVDYNPTYAEVLDWLRNKKYYISIIDYQSDNIYTDIRNSKFECSHVYRDSNFSNLLEKTIKFVLEFVEDDDSRRSKKD